MSERQSRDIKRLIFSDLKQIYNPEKPKESNKLLFREFSINSIKDIEKMNHDQLLILLKKIDGYLNNARNYYC